MPLNGLWYLNGGLFTVVGWRLEWLAGLRVDGGGHMIPLFEGRLAALLPVIRERVVVLLLVESFTSGARREWLAFGMVGVGGSAWYHCLDLGIGGGAGGF